MPGIIGQGGQAIIVPGDAVADIISASRKYHVDPWVALAIAHGEGGFNYGEVGDNGTSFGPFQLHEGGALPAGRNAAWANSPAGIDYAVRGIASVLGGSSGTAAIAAGVTNFERPAAENLAGEIASDTSWYSSETGKSGGRPPASGGVTEGGVQGAVGGAASSVGDAISSGVSGAEDFALRAGKILVGVIMLGAAIFMGVKS